MKHDLIVKAIYKINANANFVVRGENVEWLNGTTPISQSDIEAQFPAVKFDMAIEDLRTKRNKLLAETDYLALSDNTLSTEMTTYRQALRDITEGVTTVEQIDAITWPTKPGA